MPLDVSGYQIVRPGKNMHKIEYCQYSDIIFRMVWYQPNLEEIFNYEPSTIDVEEQLVPEIVHHSEITCCCFLR